MKIVIAAIDFCHRLLYHPPPADYRDWAEKFTLRPCFNNGSCSALRSLAASACLHQYLFSACEASLSRL